MLSVLVASHCRKLQRALVVEESLLREFASQAVVDVPAKDVQINAELVDLPVQEGQLAEQRRVEQLVQQGEEDVLARDSL